MISFEKLGMEWYDFIVIAIIGVCVFLFTYFIYPPLIKWLKSRDYVGYDIHKKDRPETAESGGLGLTMGLILGLVAIGIFYNDLFNEVIVFIITVLLAALVGWYDDRKNLSSIKKILLMFVTGLPILIANIYFIKFIDVDSPILPIIGRLRINIIYPLALPFIIMIMTNTVNMLEGYNGEGSGTTSIATLFMIVASLIIHSSQGIIFGVVVFASILAFYFYNKYPAKAFPGDIGTLVIGASIGLVGIFGSIEIIMVLVMLPQILNSFYVIASERGFKESHSVKTKDIWIDDENYIHSSDEKGAALTLPRLILVHGKLSEKDLVAHFMMLSLISGLFAIVGTQWILPGNMINYLQSSIIIGLCFIFYVYILFRYPKIQGISIIMVIILIIGLFSLYIINRFIYLTPLNFLYASFVAIIVLFLWYFITVKYFQYSLEKLKNSPGFISWEKIRKKFGI